MTKPWFAYAIASALLAAPACGDDDAGTPAPRTGAAAPAAAAAAKAKAATGQLVPRMHVEDMVTCPVPDAPTGHPACTPPDAPGAAPGATASKMLPECDPGSYCTQVANTWTCEPCPERESIRHEFKDRDFVEEQSRDPFQSFVVLQAGLGTTSNTAKPEPHQSCKRPDQFVAQSYSYQDLKLVGIVAQATQRKALMMPPSGKGEVVKRGDCVGKEKAVVKDIGTGYITFVVEEDADTKRPATETSVQLHPGGVEYEVTSQPTAAPAPTAPVVSPTSPPANPIRR